MYMDPSARGKLTLSVRKSLKSTAVTSPVELTIGGLNANDVLCIYHNQTKIQ